ncbi:amidohydrolase, partial [Vibrio anguillarum]|nr:amidohydrolase [Vibrio anguillarum]MBF4382010.1 amidohydrolase [Vibrio anguillarum]
MNRTSPLTLIASLIMSSNASAVEKADMILTNAKIHGHENADAIAVHDGNILFVGKMSDTKKYRSENTEVIDLEHGYVMPGFIDNHNHVFEAASEAGGNCELSMDASLEAQI